MIELREWVSAIIFCTGVAGICVLVANELTWSLVWASVLCFVLAYLIWPSKRKGQRHDDNRLADILEILIEFPMELFSWLIRFLGRLLGSKGEGIDIDI